MDSDEEDDAEEGGGGGGGEGEGEAGEAGGKNYDVLRDEDIDGQEERTLDFEGETRITPFNMKEEMEEGHFDGDGFYHFKKETDQVKDAWLEDIDWIKVKQREGDDKKYGSDIDSDVGSDDTFGSKNKADGNIMIYTEMLEFVKEGETIAKALKRLGGNKKMSSAQKWKLKKVGSIGKENGDQNMADFLRLTELANKIIETGNMDIYQETYEMINFKVQKASAPPPDPEMDMFADEGEGDKKKGTDTKKTEGPDVKEVQTGIAEVMWELRWKDADEEEIYGPFTNEKMIQWQESGYFQKGAYVRKTEQRGQWYSTRRIDFELYA